MCPKQNSLLHIIMQKIDIIFVLSHNLINIRKCQIGEIIYTDFVSKNKDRSHVNTFLNVSLWVFSKKACLLKCVSTRSTRHFSVL